MIIIPGAVYIGRHDTNVIRAVLAAVGLTKFHSGDFSYCVPFIGGFEWSGEERLLGHRLPRELRVDARRTKEQQLTHVSAKSAMYEVRGNHEVLVNESSRKGAVRMDTANFPGGYDHDVGPC